MEIVEANSRMLSINNHPISELRTVQLIGNETLPFFLCEFSCVLTIHCENQRANIPVVLSFHVFQSNKQILHTSLQDPITIFPPLTAMHATTYIFPSQSNLICIDLAQLFLHFLLCWTVGVVFTTHVINSGVDWFAKLGSTVRAGIDGEDIHALSTGEAMLLLAYICPAHKILEAGNQSYYCWRTVSPGSNNRANIMMRMRNL